MRDFLIRIKDFYNGNRVIQIISVFIFIFIIVYVIYDLVISNPTDPKYLLSDEQKKSQSLKKEGLDMKSKKEQKNKKIKKQIKPEKKRFSEENNKNINELRKKRFDSDVNSRFDFNPDF